MKQWALVAICGLVAGCSGGRAGEEAANGEAAGPVAAVRTATAEIATSSSRIDVYGVVEPGPAGTKSIVVPAEALIGSIAAPNGSDVRAGQPVVLLRASPATRAEIAKAESEAKAAQSAFARAGRMRADGLVSDADVETARAAATAAAAVRDNLGMKGGAATLRAPIAGTVQNLSAKPGDQIAAGATVATISATGDLRARFGIDPALVTRIRVGATIQVSLLDGSGTVTVAITGIDPQLDASTRLASVFARLPAGMKVGTGTPLRASLATSSASRMISIPYAALLDDGGRTYVFVVRGGVARAIDVSPGSSSGDRVKILKGLGAGDRVVIEGGTGLDDGMKVTEAGTAK